MSIMNPSQARKKFYQLLKDVNHSGEPAFISGDNEAVIISKNNWDAIQETLYLHSSGVANVVDKREEEDEVIALEDIDWDTL